MLVGNGWTGGTSDADNYLDGYLSEFYLVTGQALKASDFGKTYDTLWGPLPSDTVKNNITKAESPYDQQDNMEQLWSKTSSGWLNDVTNPFVGKRGATINTACGTQLVRLLFITALMQLVKIMFLLILMTVL